MAANLEDLDQYWSPGLDLTVRGKTYTVPLPSAELGLWCRTVAEATGSITADSTEAEMQQAAVRLEQLPRLPGQLTLAQRLLGGTYDEMTSDKVPDPYIEFCTTTAYIWIIAGEEAAERYWKSGGRPEAPGPATNRAERRAAKTGANGTAEVSGTRSPAPTSGTKSRRKSRSRNPNR